MGYLQYMLCSVDPGLDIHDIDDVMRSSISKCSISWAGCSTVRLDVEIFNSDYLVLYVCVCV